MEQMYNVSSNPHIRDKMTTIHFFEACHITVFCKSCKAGRNHMARTDAYTTSAIDTCSLDLLRLGNCVTLQEKQGRSCLRTWNMKIIQRKSHHRSAGDCFCDLFLQSACSIYQFRQICSCKNGKVLRCTDTISGNRYITADNRLS